MVSNVFTDINKIQVSNGEKNMKKWLEIIEKKNEEKKENNSLDNWTLKINTDPKLWTNSIIINNICVVFNAIISKMAGDNSNVQTR